MGKLVSLCVISLKVTEPIDNVTWGLTVLAVMDHTFYVGYLGSWIYRSGAQRSGLELLIWGWLVYKRKSELQTCSSRSSPHSCMHPQPSGWISRSFMKWRLPTYSLPLLALPHMHHILKAFLIPILKLPTLDMLSVTSLTLHVLFPLPRMLSCSPSLFDCLIVWVPKTQLKLHLLWLDS